MGEYKAFPLKSRKRQGCLLSLLLFNTVLVIVGHARNYSNKGKKPKYLLSTIYVLGTFSYKF